jgi:CubicO group peptidase (beta-lactamase class C family)
MLCLSLAFLALVISAAFDALPKAVAQPGLGIWRGYVSDEMCGKSVAADCNRRCFKEGRPAVLVLDDTDEVLAISNPEALNPYPGEHVEVTGDLEGHALRVSAVKVIVWKTPGGSAASSPTRHGFSPATAQHIHRIEQGVGIPLDKDQPPIHLSLQELMKLYRVPGLSVAVIDHYKIAWAKGYGVTEAGASTPVTPHTLFMAGSIAKTPTAAAALYLVEHGKLALDEDVNQELKSWKVPQSEFTAQQKVTLRRILSHTAGTTVHGFPGYAVDEPRPTLLQALNGEKPANTDAVRVDLVPGTKWRYSGGGVLIEQQLMMDVTGEPFPQLMREVLFDKLGMGDSTYEQPLPPARAAQAASGTYGSGRTVRGKWHVYPEMAAGGLWTTPTDLATFAIEIALSRQGKSNHVLSQAMAQEMLKPQADRVQEIALGNQQHVDRMGLGFFLGDASRPDLFGHIGDDEGFQAMLYLFGDSGQGAVVMANSDNGILLGDYLLSNIAREYGWKEYVPSNRPTVGSRALLLSVAQRKGTAAAIQAYWRLKRANAPEFATDQETLIGLGYALFAANKLPDAVEVMKLEVQEYPQYWNAYDSLGEMYMHAGDTQAAIQNYEKSVELNPGDQGAIGTLKKLKAAHGGQSE